MSSCYVKAKKDLELEDRYKVSIPKGSVLRLINEQEFICSRSGILGIFRAYKIVFLTDNHEDFKYTTEINTRFARDEINKYWNLFEEVPEEELNMIRLMYE